MRSYRDLVRYSLLVACAPSAVMAQTGTDTAQAPAASGAPAQDQAVPKAGGNAAQGAETQTASDQSTVAVGDSSGTGAADQDPADIVVTGFRASLESSLAKKRSAPNVVEVLSSEDIGKLPDPSIAESLARLPGVAANRDRGNATTLSIRGMGPELVNTLINGRELVSAEANRNVRYEQFPAELITGAYVYKSPTAAQAEGAIAGQIDLQTIRPLSQTKTQQFVLNGRVGYAPMAGKDIPGVSPFGYSVSGSYIGKFANDTIGVAIGYARSDEPTATERADIYPYLNSFLDLNGDGSANDEVPSGFLAVERSGRQKRDAALGTIQFDPGNGLQVVADLMWSKLDYAEQQKGFQADNLVYGNYFLNPPTVQNNGATGGTIVNYNDYGATIGATNQYFAFKDTLWAGGLNTKYESDHLVITADAAYSQTHRNQTYFSVLTRPYYTDANGQSQPVLGVTPVSNAVPPLTIGYASNGSNPPSFSVDRSLTDPSTNLVYVFQVPANGGGAPLINDALFTGRFDVERKFDGSALSSIAVGFRHTDRSKDFTQRTQAIYPVAAVPNQFILDPVHFDGKFAGYPDTLSIDLLPYVNSLGGLKPVQTEGDKGGSWVVDERTYAAYAQANFDTTIAGIQVLANAGIRWVRTLEQSRGFTVQQTADTNFADVATPVSYTNNFTDWLPNANATLKFTNRLQLRLAASKAIARAPLDSLRAGYNLYNYGTPQAFGGNPMLKPFRATQYDASLEWYVSKDTALTLAGFYKDLDTFIVTQTTPITTTTAANGTQQGTFQQPVNGEGGTIKGLEVSYQQVFSFLPGFLRGLGIYANYSYTDSNISVAQADNLIQSIPLPNLSKHVGNAAVFFNAGGFEARVAYRARSSYATSVGGQNLLTFNRGDQLVDAFAAYEFGKTSALQGLRLSVQAQNITNAPFRTYSGYTERSGRYEEFGRSFFLSGTYRF